MHRAFIKQIKKTYKSGDLFALEGLLESSQELRKTETYSGEALLNLLRLRGRRISRTLKTLIQRGFKSDWSPTWTPLHEAAFYGFNDTVLQLLDDSQIAINQDLYNGKTALCLAAMEGHADVVSTLLKHQANPNLADVHGETPLHQAARYGHAEVAKLLLQNGAFCTMINGSHITPLLLAAIKKHWDVAELLIAATGNYLIGDTIKKFSIDLEDAWRYYYHRDFPEVHQVIFFLYKSSKNNNTTFIQEAIDGLRSRETKCSTAGLEEKRKGLICAMKKVDAASAKKIISECPEAILDHDCAHFLDVAANDGDKNGAQTLLKAGVKADTAIYQGITPLHLTTSLDIAKLLVEYGANINATEALEKETPLHIAARWGNKEMVTYFLETGADVNALNRDFQKPLDLARHYSHTEIESLLISWESK